MLCYFNYSGVTVQFYESGSFANYGEPSIMFYEVIKLAICRRWTNHPLMHKLWLATITVQVNFHNPLPSEYKCIQVIKLYLL